MAMKDKSAKNFRTDEGNNQLGFSRFPRFARWNAEGIPKTVEIRRCAVYFCDEKSRLVNVKVVVLRIFVGYFIGV